jgi:hypothetical protein
MKNLFLALGFVVVLASCGGSTTEAEAPKTDSTAVDSAVVAVDTTAACSTTTAVDTTK